jgi:hypothetical protein
VQRQKIKFIEENTTAEEAMMAFRRAIRGEDYES